MTAPRAKIYIRESGEEALKGYSPDEMVRQCRAKAATLGADVADADVTIEAAKRDEYDPPGLMAQIDAAERGEYDYLISWDMLRLTGDIGKHLWFKEAMSKTRVSIHYVTVEFPDSEEGELFEILAGGIGRYERLKTRRRTQNGIAGKLARRQPIGGGVLAYGLERVKDGTRTVGYAPKDGKIQILRRIVDELATRTMQEVCDGLNAEAVSTPSGRGRWTTGIIARLLANGTYVGDYQYGAVRRIPGRRPDGRRIYHSRRNPDDHVTRFAIDPVVDPSALAAARAGLAARKRRGKARRGEADDPYAVRGRVRCAHCDGALSVAMNNGYRRYACLRAYGRDVDPSRRCPLPEVAADALERAAWAAFVARISDRAALERALAEAMDPGEAGRRHDDQRRVLAERVGGCERRIENAMAVMLDFGQGTRQYDLARDASVAAEAELVELRAGLAELDKARPVVLSATDADRARDAWAELAAGLDAAGGSASAQRMLYAIVDLRGTVGLATDGAGERLGRKHAYRLGWAMRLALSGGTTNSSESVLRWDSLGGLRLAPAAA